MIKYHASAVDDAFSEWALETTIFELKLIVLFYLFFESIFRPNSFVLNLIYL